MNAPLTQTELRAAQTLSDPRWLKVRAREKGADGDFVYSVRTTGVYCRPSCAARPARPENVAFHMMPSDAERAGFRPCMRCKPNANAPSHADAITAACRLIETADEAPTLAELATRAGLSPHHFHRVFKAATGVTPRAYAAAHRTSRVRDGLKDARTVTEAIYDAGYNSGSRFYEQSNAALGMTPKVFRAGGAKEEVRFAVGQCSLGAVLVGATDKGVCAITFGDDPEILVRDLQDRFSRANIVGGDEAFERTVAKVVALVETPEKGFDLPLDVRGTAFQRRVWEALRTIPVGKTASYADVAEKIGSPKAVRAVANACANNSLAVAIPCHRVVRKSGALADGGYRWGIARKQALLVREKRA